MEQADSERYIFISDLHLGDNNSYRPDKQGAYPYGWTNKHVVELENFLTELDQHEETSGTGEVMIVGDLVDTWVCPSALNPPSFDDVLSAEHNSGVISALNRVASQKKLKYIPGNHDMLIKRETLLKYISGLEVVGNATGHVKFYDGLLVAEHGHEYCLFNAVDTWSRHNGHLPMGIFMAQLAAVGTYEKNDKPDYLEILEKFVKSFSPNKDFAKQVLNAIRNYEIKDVGAVATDPFLMNNMDGLGAEVSYDEVINVFGDIYDQWDKCSGSGIPATLAAAGDGGILRPAAELKYLIPGHAKIAIFGHTHKYEVKRGYVGAEDSENAPHEASRASVIYGNCGTWIDSRNCNFIVTEKCTVKDENRIYLRGYEYTFSREKRKGAISGPLDEAYVVV
ncbi:MAG: metallophosphoesterase [Deltaproteobacteria bacterium]|nr:metallophosphoesterase [Deltaproteobacteria bacterium]